MLAKPGQTIYLRYKSPIRNTALYPQAKIYDSATDALITSGTVNLSASAQDTSLYLNTMTVPSAEGVYHIVITPYTDSGHTTPDEVEQSTLENLEVRQIASTQATAMGGMIMENDLSNVADQVVKKLEKKIKVEIPKIKEVDLKPVLAAIAAIEMPKADPIDFAPIIRELKTLTGKIKPVELGKIQNAADNIQTKLGNLNVAELVMAFQSLAKQVEMAKEEMCKMEKMKTGMMELMMTLDKHKEMMFKHDDMMRAQVQKMVETARQLGFMNTVGAHHAIEEMARKKELMEMDA